MLPFNRQSFLFSLVLLSMCISCKNTPGIDVPIIASGDVVVVGGGPAGVSAAYAAAREGANVVLIERDGYLGGLWTGGLVLPLNASRALEKDGITRQSCMGIMGEMVSRLEDMNMIYPNDGKSGPVPDPEATKYMLQCMLEEVGVQVIYYA